MKKKCLACEEIKPLKDFYKTPRTKIGVVGRCKQCYNDNVYAIDKPKEPMYITETRDEIRKVSSKNKDQLDNLIGKIGSFNMAYGRSQAHDELLNMCYGKMSNTLRAGN